MFEHHREPLLSSQQFIRRQLIYLLAAALIIAGSLWLGMLGYRLFEKLSWMDALLNAAMLLGGEGPIAPLHTDAGKLFASFYALYSGIIFLVVVGVIFAPLYHRFLHRFHLDLDEKPGEMP
jgi:hypothetical protein